MFQMMIIDDEPAAIRPLQRVIEKKYQQFHIMGTAENGEEALKIMERVCPDVVLTDVKMPVLDGIGFTQIVKERFPSVYVIIVSGYEDFSYAQNALKFGVLDYILKPVTQSTLDDALKKVERCLLEDIHQKRHRLIRQITIGGEPKMEEIKACFPSEAYYAAIIRKNGLPRRFSSLANFEITSMQEELIYLYGRDEMEFLYLCPKELIFMKSFRELMEGVMQNEKATGSFLTTVLKETPFKTKDFCLYIKRLYGVLDRQTVIGKTQTIFLNETWERGEDRTVQNTITEDHYIRVEYLIREKQWNRLRRDVKAFLIIWYEQGIPQLVMEKHIRHFIYMIEASHKIATKEEDLDFMLEDAFFHATCIEDLAESLDYVFSKLVQADNLYDIKMDSQNFVDQIKEYVLFHLEENISLQSVCKSFGISQTYINKLFRKYEEKTFYNFLIEERIRKAKRMIEQNPDFLIKDVAAMVGYDNQFYFSRLFRTVTGVSPTEYAEKEIFAEK